MTRVFLKTYRLRINQPLLQATLAAWLCLLSGQRDAFGQSVKTLSPFKVLSLPKLMPNI